MLAAIFIAALNLRIAIAVVGPLIEEIRADTGMSSSVAGLLAAIPFACMSVFSFTGPPIVGRWGLKRVITGALVLVGGGCLLRATMPDAALLIAATVPIGAGIALAGLSLPILVKQYFPRHPGAATGAYTTAIAVGIIGIGFSAVPLSDALGGWRGVLALTAVPALLGAVVWAGTSLEQLADHTGPAPSADARPASAGARDPMRPSLGRPGGTELLLGLVFALQALCFTAMVSWGAAIYEEAGWDRHDAALGISSLGIMLLVASLTVSWTSDRGDRRMWIAAFAGSMTLGTLGAALTPEHLGALWMALFGLGTGSLFPLLLALPLDLANDPSRVGRLSAWMLGIGYLGAALGPLLVGALRDMSGGFELPLLVLTALGVANIASALVIPRPGRVSVQTIANIGSGPRPASATGDLGERSE